MRYLFVILGLWLSGCTQGGGGAASADLSVIVTSTQYSNGSLVLTGSNLLKVQNTKIGATTPTTDLTITSQSDSSLELRALSALALKTKTTYLLLLTVAEATTTVPITIEPTGRSSCPAGMTLIGTAGATSAFCIDTPARTSAAFFTAIGNCANADAYLCSQMEWYTACANGSGLSGMANSTEWIALTQFGAGMHGITQGGSFCSDFGQIPVATSEPYRCCVK